VLCAVIDTIAEVPSVFPGIAMTRLPDIPSGRTVVVFGRLRYASAIWLAAAVASAAVRYRVTKLFSSRFVPARMVSSGVDAETT